MFTIKVFLERSIFQLFQSVHFFFLGLILFFVFPLLVLGNNLQCCLKYFHLSVNSDFSREEGLWKGLCPHPTRPFVYAPASIVPDSEKNCPLNILAAVTVGKLIPSPTNRIIFLARFSFGFVSFAWWI